MQRLKPRFIGFARVTCFTSVALCGLAVLTSACVTRNRDAGSSVLALSPLPAERAPRARSLHTALWTGAGEGMLVWGGSLAAAKTGEVLNPATTDGAVYYPGTKRWFPLPELPQTSRYHHSAIWTGVQMLVWGGVDVASQERVNSGWMLDTEDDKWFTITREQAPSPRSGQSAVWTGERMLVWGGEDDNGPRADGSSYDLVEDAWAPLTTFAAPDARSFHTAVWTGTEMLVWGGIGTGDPLPSGGRYDPQANSWRPMSQVNAPRGRLSHTALWTGKHMIVWGGRMAGDEFVGDGALYDPATDTWTPIPVGPNAPSARELHTAVWTGNEMIVWGGQDDSGALATGAAFNPTTKKWRTLRFIQKPVPRAMHTAVWTGDAMLVFGGRDETGTIIEDKVGIALTERKAPSN